MFSERPWKPAESSRGKNTEKKRKLSENRVVADQPHTIVVVVVVVVAVVVVVIVEDLASWLKPLYWNDYNLLSMVDSDVVAAKGPARSALAAQKPVLGFDEALLEQKIRE